MAETEKLVLPPLGTDHILCHIYSGIAYSPVFWTYYIILFNRLYDLVGIIGLLDITFKISKRIKEELGKI